MEHPAGMRKTILSGLASLVVGCGSPSMPSVEPSPTASAPAEPTVSNVVRTRLPKETPCGEGDACGFYLQVISPGSEAEHLTDGAMKLLRGHCGGAVIVYRDKRNVMGAGSVFKTADEKRACAAALGRTSDADDYPSEAVWRKAD